MIRVRFEPIDIRDEKEFEEIYKRLSKIINSTFTDKFDELIPAIRKMYLIDDQGFPLNDKS